MHQRVLPVRHRSRITLPMFCLQPTHQENDSIHQDEKNSALLWNSYSSTHHTSRNTPLPPARVQQSDTLESPLLWSPEGSETRESIHPRKAPAIATFSLPSLRFSTRQPTCVPLDTSTNARCALELDSAQFLRRSAGTPCNYHFCCVGSGLLLLENRLFWKGPPKSTAR